MLQAAEISGPDLDRNFRMASEFPVQVWTGISGQASLTLYKGTDGVRGSFLLPLPPPHVPKPPLPPYSSGGLQPPPSAGFIRSRPDLVLLLPVVLLLQAVFAMDSGNLSFFRSRAFAPSSLELLAFFFIAWY